MTPLRHHHRLRHHGRVSVRTQRGRGQPAPAKFCPIRWRPFNCSETAGAAIASRFELQDLLRQTKGGHSVPTEGLAGPRVAGE
jgi:hypothetical protein